MLLRFIRLLETKDIPLKFIIVLGVVAVILAQDEECGENQHPVNCETPCPVTCENYKNPPKFCGRRGCVPGCHCNEGFVLDEYTASCIKPEHCGGQDEECGENQHPVNCETPCPVTCENYKNPPKVCGRRGCLPGCHCNEGFVLDEYTESCIKPEHCGGQERQCGENQHYVNCRTNCPVTCENYKDPPWFCHRKKCYPGCQCDEGFVLEENTERCIKPEHCGGQGSIRFPGAIRFPDDSDSESCPGIDATCVSYLSCDSRRRRYGYGNKPTFCGWMEDLRTPKVCCLN